MMKKSILNMTHDEARSFFMEPTSYFDVILPQYFELKHVLSRARDLLNNCSLDEIKKSDPSQINKLNYALFINENGEYDWEPYILIHPLLYVDLINYITQDKVWSKIIDRFKKFRNSMTKSYSIPTEDENNKDSYIKTTRDSMNKDIMQNYSQYNYCIKTHIMNCYNSVYTHTIAWAIETKKDAKQHKKAKNAGNIIDKKIEHMQNEQTNGIPRGSVIFDTILELILSYADYKLYKYIKVNANIPFKLLRYKSNYIIFTKNKYDADTIMKWLLVVLDELNMSFNGKETHIYDSKDIILNLFKPDQLYELGLNDIVGHLSIYDELLQIKALSNKYPNSQNTKDELFNCYKRISKEMKKSKDVRPLINKLLTGNNYNLSIDTITSIIVKNPSSFLMGICLISLILSLVYKEQKQLKINISHIKDIINKEINKIQKRFTGMVHTEYAGLWIQRLKLGIDGSNNIKEAYNPRYSLYNKVLNPNKSKLWNSKWMRHNFDDSSVIDKNERNYTKLQVPQDIVKIANKLYN